MGIFIDSPTRPEPEVQIIVSFGYIDDEKFIVVGFMDLNEKPSSRRCHIRSNMNPHDLAKLRAIAEQLTRRHSEYVMEFHNMTVKIRAIFPPILSDEEKEILDFEWELERKRKALQRSTDREFIKFSRRP